MICNSWMKTEGYQKVSRQPFRKWPFAFPIAFALVLIDFEKAVYYLFRQKERIDLICERQHPAASKRCLNRGPADLRTMQESETEQIFFFSFSKDTSLGMKECCCHLEGAVVGTRKGLSRQGMSFILLLPRHSFSLHLVWRHHLYSPFVLTKTWTWWEQTDVMKSGSLLARGFPEYRQAHKSWYAYPCHCVKLLWHSQDHVWVALTPLDPKSMHLFLSMPFW